MLILTTLLISFFLLGLAVRFAFRDRFSWGELGLAYGLLLVLLGGGYAMAVHGQTGDTLVMSGKVTAKERNRVHCRHSYSCRCRQVCSGSGKNRSCHQHCDTCYHHAYDIDWDVKSTVGTFTIGTIDWQGLKEPPRWTQVRLDDPVSRTDGYTNWLKAVPDSVFRRTTAEALPAYPLKIYDYYRIDRVVLDGVTVPEDLLKRLNAQISEALKDVAAQKQVNLVLVLTARPPAFAQELRAGWINGKKNDLVVVIGAKSFPAIDWADAFGWSANDLLNVKTRDEIRAHGVVDDQIVPIAVGNIEKFWVRKPMEEYHYLSAEIEPSTTAIVVLACLGVAALAGCSFYFIRNEVI